MSQKIDITARIRNNLVLARIQEPGDADKRARVFVAALAGSLQEDSPMLAAEVFALLINTNMLKAGGNTLLVMTGGVQ